MRHAVPFRLVLSTLTLFSLALTGYGQSEAQIDPDISTFTSAGRKNVVQDTTGKLYCAFVDDAAVSDRPVRLYSSVNGGANWAAESFVFNDATSGLSGTNPATGCAMAIDSTGTLHVIWGRYYYPSFFRQYYRWYDPVTGTPSSIVDLTSMVGATDTTRTDAMGILVDAADYVFVTTQGAGSWRDDLWRSTQPLNPTATFASIGSVSSDSYSAQNVGIAADNQGRIHCTFYNNNHPGWIVHRAYDTVSSSWVGSNFNLGDTTGGQDRYSQIAADNLGNVHVTYMRDGTTSPIYEYRMWNGTWGPAVSIMSFTSTQMAGSNAAMHTLACDESTGKVNILFRDMSAGGRMVTYEKTLTASSFSYVYDVQPPTTGKNEYIFPTSRGTLYPAFNRTGLFPCGTMRRGAAKPFELLFLDWLSDPAGKVYGTGCAGSGGFIPTLQLGLSTPVPGGQVALEIDKGYGGATALLFFGLTEAALPMGSGCFLNVQPLLPLIIPVPLGGMGPGIGSTTLSGVVPAGTSGAVFTMQVFMADPGGALGFSNSNGLKLTIS